MSKGFKHRERLWKENPRCHWCGCLTVLLPLEYLHEHSAGQKAARRKFKFPPDAATIEHLYSRWDPRRSSPHIHGERRHVIACAKCNNEIRNTAEEHANIEEKRKRSKSFPIGAAVIKLAMAVENAVRYGTCIEIGE